MYFIGFFHRLHPEEYMLPFKNVLLQPDRITCGPTSVAMLLSYYGEEIKVDQVKIRTKTVWFSRGGNDVGMTSPDYIAIALGYFGISSVVDYGNLDVLKHVISSGIPCIVLVRSGEFYWHYMVVIGYTREGVIVADPGVGEIYEMEESHFEGCWSWRKDLRGNICKNVWITNLLQEVEIYPYTYIHPDYAKGEK